MVHGLETIAKLNDQAVSAKPPTRLTFDPGVAEITSDWLRENADRIDIRKVNAQDGTELDCSVAVFEVESEQDGFVHVRVGMRKDMREAADIEIDTGWMTSAGMQTCRVGIGLYTKLNDLTALLELLARGNHF